MNIKSEFLKRNQGLLIVGLILAILLSGIAAWLYQKDSTWFSFWITFLVFYYSSLIGYAGLLYSQQESEYQKHKIAGTYVPSKRFNEEIRKIELKRGFVVERKAKNYTSNIKYAERLLNQIWDEKHMVNIEYNYKEDLFEYCVSGHDNIRGKAFTKEMAICIMYVEIFG